MKKISKCIARYSEFIKYSVVNAGTTLLYIALYYVFVQYMHINYVISNGIAYCLSIGVAYVLTRIFVFGIRQESIRQILLFILTRVLILAMNSLLIWILVDVGHLNKFLAQILVTAFCFFWSYLLNKSVFKAQKTHDK